MTVDPKDIPPHDLEAEIAVVGSMLLDPKAARAAAAVLTAEDFYVTAHAVAFRILDRMAQDEQPIDPVLFRDELQKDKQFENVGGTSFISRIVAAVPSTANAVHYAKIVFRAARERDVWFANRRFSEEQGNGHADAALERLLTAREALKQADEPAREQPQPEAEDFAVTVDGPEPAAPVMFVDRFIVRDTLNIFFGPPGSGKSWLMMALCYDAVTTGGTLLGSEELHIHLPEGGNPDVVLWIYGSEDNRARILRRLKKLHKGGDPNYPLRPQRFLYQTLPDGVLLNSPEGWYWLDALIQRYHPTIVVLDTIASLTASTLDVNKAEQVVPFMQKLLAIRATNHLTILAGHHTSKPAKDAGRSVTSKASSMLGSQAWLAMTEGCFMVDAKDGNTADVKIHCVKTKDVENPIPALRACLDRDTGRFHLLDEEETAPVRDVVTKKGGRPAKFTADAVLALRGKFPDGLTWNETVIAAALNIGHATWIDNRDAVASELLRRDCVVISGVLKWAKS